MDWNLVRSYLMVAEHGSTLAAAKYLEVTQSTISRHLSELERQLNVQLFDRRKSGLALTDKGMELLSFAKQMDSVADNLQAQASHYSSAVTGTIRVSASEVLAVDVLPFCIPHIVNDNPDLQIEIVSTNEESNLLTREADIAVRMFAPQQQEIIAKHILDIPLAFYAHKNYIERFGQPDSMESFTEQKLIGFDKSPLFINAAKQFGFKLTRKDFDVRSDSIIVQNQCAIAGLGIAVMQKQLAQRIPDMQVVQIGVELPPLPLYLAAQQELRVSRKLRVVFDALESSLREFYNTKSVRAPA